MHDVQEIIYGYLLIWLKIPKYQKKNNYFLNDFLDKVYFSRQDASYKAVMHYIWRPLIYATVSIIIFLLV